MDKNQKRAQVRTTSQPGLTSELLQSYLQRLGQTTNGGSTGPSVPPNYPSAVSNYHLDDWRRNFAAISNTPQKAISSVFTRVGAKPNWQIPGTLENAMTQIDRAARLSPQDRQTVKDFLWRSQHVARGRSYWSAARIPPSALAYAVSSVKRGPQGLADLAQSYQTPSLEGSFDLPSAMRWLDSTYATAPNYGHLRNTIKYRVQGLLQASTNKIGISDLTKLARQTFNGSYATEQPSIFDEFFAIKDMLEARRNDPEYVGSEEQSINIARGDLGETPDERGRRRFQEKATLGRDPIKGAIEAANLDLLPLYSHGIRMTPLMALFLSEGLSHPYDVAQQEAETLRGSPAFGNLAYHLPVLGSIAAGIDMANLSVEAARRRSLEPVGDLIKGTYVPWTVQGMNPFAADIPYGERSLRMANLFNGGSSLSRSGLGLRGKEIATNAYDVFARDVHSVDSRHEPVEGERHVRSSQSNGSSDHPFPANATKEPVLPVLAQGKWHLDVHPSTTLQKLTELIRHEAREVLAAFDENGELVAAPIVGERHHVDIGSFRHLLRNRWVLHNHPTGTVLSHHDFREASENNVLGIEAVLPSGRSLVLERPSGGWPDSEDLLGAYGTGYGRALKRRGNLQTEVKEINRALKARFGRTHPRLLIDDV